MNKIASRAFPAFAIGFALFYTGLLCADLYLLAKTIRLGPGHGKVEISS